jgi:hypothetical protein
MAGRSDRFSWERTFAMPPPYPVIRARLDPAIASRDLAAVRSAARDRPGVVTLADAVDVLLVMLEADDPAFETAAGHYP